MIAAGYAGTELGRGGTVVGVHHPSHNSMSGSTYDNTASMNVAKKFRPSGKWISVCWCPVISTEYGFKSADEAVYPMLLHIKAPVATTSIDYDWEVVGNFEVNGFNVRGMTKGQSDPVGTAAVSNALQMTSMVHDDPKSHEEGFFGRVWNSLTHGISSAGVSLVDEVVGQAGAVGSAAGTMIGRQASSYLANIAEGAELVLPALAAL